MTHSAKPEVPKPTERHAFFANAGVISVQESAYDAVVEWANDMERKLLRLHCGQWLPRDGHRAWARSIPQALVMYDEDCGWVVF